LNWPTAASSEKSVMSDSKRRSTRRAPVYRINARVVSAESLIASDPANLPDAYVLLELSGSKETAFTAPDSSTVTPTWNQDLALDGFVVASDNLKISVCAKGKSKDRKSTEAIGSTELLVHEIPLGVTTPKRIPLLQTDSKGKPEKKAKPGSGGYVNITFHISKLTDTPFTDSPWSTTVCHASIEFVRASYDDPADAFLTAQLDQGGNVQKWKSKPKPKDSGPTFGDRRVFHAAPSNSIQVDVHKSGDDDPVIGTASIVIADFNDETQEKELDLKPSGKLVVKVKVTREGESEEPAEKSTKKSKHGRSHREPPPPPEPVVQKPKYQKESRLLRLHEHPGDRHECPFRWGEYSSSFSTDFTGYSSCSIELSPLRESEEEWHNLHVHNEAGVPREVSQAHKVSYSLTGTIVEAKDLIPIVEKAPGSYVTVQLVGKGRKKGEVLQSPAVKDLKYGYDFNLGIAKKKHTLRFTVYQEAKRGGQQIGFAAKPIRDLPVDSKEPIEIALGKPPRFLERLGEFSDWGTLRVTFDLHAFD
jgi:hypothetical protein